MTEKKEPTVEWSDQVREAAERDPKIADLLRDFGAKARQAMQMVEAGQYKSFDDAMEALTGERPQKIELDDE
jgi:hypothetical protein